MRRCVLLLVLPLVAACTSAGSVTTVGPQSEPATEPSLLFFANDHGVTVYDTASRHATLTVPGGVVSPDRSAVFASAADGSSTRLDAFDPRTAQSRSVATVLGSHEIRVANHDGTAVVLGPPRPDAANGYPGGRLSTTLTFVSLDGAASRALEVAGNVEPEAFSVDDSNLFVIEYLPADAPTGYEVRRLDLATGQLHNVRTTDDELTRPMAGRARTQVLSPDGKRLYTLYVVEDSAHEGGGYAFVHVADLDTKEAFCIDLPEPFGAGTSSAYAVAISRDGNHLYSIDAEHGAIADLDTVDMEIVKTASTATPKGGSVFAAVGPRGRLYVGAGTELWSFEPSSLTMESSWALDGSVAAVLTAPSDDHVYVAVDDTIVAFDGTDIGAGPVSTTPVPGAPGLVAAEPVPSVEDRETIDCAC
jgi:hypothetical protein